MYFAPGYVIGDVLAPLRRDHDVVGVLEDEGWYADCRKYWPHVHFGDERHRDGDGCWARRQTFVPCPGGPNFLVPRHVRIREMLPFPRAPHSDIGSDDLLAVRSSFDPFSHRIGVDLEGDQRGCAGRMCCRKQHRRRESRRRPRRGPLRGSRDHRAPR